MMGELSFQDMDNEEIEIDIVKDAEATEVLQPLKITCTKTFHAEMMNFLKSYCEDSGAEYASFWSICGGRLCIISAWAKYNGGRSFVSDSSGFMFEPGVGAIGRAFNEEQGEFIEDVRCLSLERFPRLDVATNNDIRSLLIVPWSGYGVLELGAQGPWQVPSNFIRTASIRCIPPAAEWEAVLWKRSRFLRCWHRRLFRLIGVEDGWQLSSCDVVNARVTGTWKLDRCLPYIPIVPKHGFSATMELNDVVLATDTRDGADAMEELATILNGCLMRQGKPKKIPVKSVQKPCSLVKAYSIVDGRTQ
jgi:hypothetical protein